MNAPEKLPASPEPHVMHTYGRLPLALSHGRGCWVWDTEGRKYLDGLGGIAVNTLGHAHPKLVPALQEQIGKLIHSSNYYLVPLQEQLAAKLCELSGLTNVFFCSTGLEANECALKIARKFGHDKGIDRPEIIVYEGAFHGRSIATLSATANPKVHGRRRAGRGEHHAQAAGHAAVAVGNVDRTGLVPAGDEVKPVGLLAQFFHQVDAGTAGDTEYFGDAFKLEIFQQELGDVEVPPNVCFCASSQSFSPSSCSGRIRAPAVKQRGDAHFHPYAK